MGGFAPAHYLKQFHPEVRRRRPSWTRRRRTRSSTAGCACSCAKNDWALNPELPVLSPWKTVDADQHADVDAGAQPVQRLRGHRGQPAALHRQGRADAGREPRSAQPARDRRRVRLPGAHIDLGKLPVFLENQEKGNYKVYLDPGDYGGRMIIKFNLNYDADPEIAKWFNTADFRRALSLGIDRDQINETFWLGMGTPGSVVPGGQPTSTAPARSTGRCGRRSTSRRPTRCSTRSASAKKDAEGYRLRSDGKGRLRIEIMTLGGQFVQFTQIAEMIREQWKKIGIDLDVQEVERSLALKRTAANEQQLGAWNNDGSEHLFTFPLPRVPLRARRRRLLGAAVRQVVPLRRRAGQGARAADEGADGQVEEGLRRAGEGAHPARQGHLEDRGRGGLHHRRDRHGPGRPWACAWSRTTWATSRRASTTARTARLRGSRGRSRSTGRTRFRERPAHRRGRR